MIIGTMLMMRILKLSAINSDFPVQVYKLYIYNNCNNIYDSSKNILKYISVKYKATSGSSPNAGVFPVDHNRLHCTVVLGQWMLYPTTVL